MFVHRPRLVGAGECDYVFRPISTSRLSAKKPDEPVTISFLSRNVYRVSQRYIPDCPGFSMHAFRHLSATEYVKNTPAGYAVAAAVLHDREETVSAAYSWVAPADKIIFWNQYISARRERRGEVDGDLDGRGDAFTEAVE